MDDFDRFLLDHAAAEKKASGMALSMVSHYPDRTRLVAAMTDLAVEEMVLQCPGDLRGNKNEKGVGPNLMRFVRDFPQPRQR